MENDPYKYLVELEHAEHNILSRLHEFILNISDFMVSLGIYPRHSWYLIELPLQRLVPSIKGEIDILAGNFEFADPGELEGRIKSFSEENPDTPPGYHFNYCAGKLAYDGGLKWPPSLDYLVGIEVKFSYLPLTAPRISSDEFKARKDSPQKIKKIRLELEKLLQAGFNKVGLFEFLANPPADGIGSEPWLIAGRIASKAVKEMEGIYVSRIAKGSPVGHGSCSISGINGRDECASGAISPRVFRHAQDNPWLLDEETRSNRHVMEQHLTEVLCALPHPRTLPAVFIYDKKTREIRYANENHFSL
jgi:hypothetical protein